MCVGICVSAFSPVPTRVVRLHRHTQRTRGREARRTILRLYCLTKPVIGVAVLILKEPWISLTAAEFGNALDFVVMGVVMSGMEWCHGGS